MDHLPPVTDPATSKTVIPYLGYLCSFDGTDFCTFPKSKGWKIVSDEVDGDVISRLDGTEPSDEAFAAFIQAWLFFGLVYQYFHNLGISINLDDFIAQGSTESHVTTAALPSMIERLATVEQQVDIATQKTHLRKTLTFLYDVGAVIDNNLSFPYLRYKDDPSTLQKLIIAESIAILGETLMHATKKMWAHLRDDLNEISEGRFYKKFRMAESAALSIKRLELLGWCKSDRIMMSRMVDTMGLAYASQLKRQPTANGHTKCTLYECLELQVDTNSYETQHVTTGCDCGESAVDVQCLVDVIESGCVPKVRVIASNTNQGIQQQVEVTGDELDFVAFSHVWAHGLGNENANGLPYCQMRRLQDLANKVYTLDGRKVGANVPFWIDTLCIPVSPHAIETRKEAIVNINQVFSKASMVLVLDKELQKVPVNASALEKELRVSTCAWSRRVWTLLEALTPARDKLRWQFREKALSVADIWNTERQHCVTEFTYHFTTLETRYPELTSEAKQLKNLSSDFLSIVSALQYRSVSRVEDETLCIAPLLSLSRKEILATKDPRIRMKTFLSFWQNIPAYFIFFEGARIDEDGYRWMPQSFVDGIHKSTAIRTNDQFTTFNNDGLLVSYPGLIFEPSELGESKKSLTTGFLNRVDNIWYRVRDAGMIMESKLPETQRWVYWYENMGTLGRAALVLEYPSAYSRNYILAVLVLIKQHGDTIQAIHLCRVWLDQVHEPLASVSQANGNGLTAANMMQSTAMDQKWRIG